MFRGGAGVGIDVWKAMHNVMSVGGSQESGIMFVKLDKHFY